MNTTILSMALLGLTATAATAEVAGYAPLTLDAPHHGRDMLGAVWFPSQGDGRQFTFAENGVFHGVTVTEEASVAEGEFPVVLLSHGMGGNIRSLAWLASGLAEAGAVVVSVNHPNSTWGDFDLAAGLQHWTRVQDLSVALDALESDPHFAGKLDMERVMAAGFSYGGWTALSMGGLRGDLDGYVDHCASYGEASSHCDDLMGAEIRLQDVPADAWNASYADPRVTHVMAIEPGFTWGVTDTVGLLSDVSLIGLGDGDDRMLATDFDMSGFAVLVPAADVTRIVPAMHFTALPLCKPMGAAILLEEGDDPVCTDPEGADREAIHAEILATMVADLGL